MMDFDCPQCGSEMEPDADDRSWTCPVCHGNGLPESAEMDLDEDLGLVREGFDLLDKVEQILELANYGAIMAYFTRSRAAEIAAANRAYCIAHGLDPEVTQADTFNLIAWLWRELEKAGLEVVN